MDVKPLHFTHAGLLSDDKLPAYCLVLQTEVSRSSFLDGFPFSQSVRFERPRCSQSRTETTRHAPLLYDPYFGSVLVQRLQRSVSCGLQTRLSGIGPPTFPCVIKPTSSSGGAIIARSEKEYIAATPRLRVGLTRTIFCPICKNRYATFEQKVILRSTSTTLFRLRDQFTVRGTSAQARHPDRSVHQIAADFRHRWNAFRSRLVLSPTRTRTG